MLSWSLFSLLFYIVNCKRKQDSQLTISSIWENQPIDIKLMFQTNNRSLNFDPNFLVSLSSIKETGKVL